MKKKTLLLPKAPKKILIKTVYDVGCIGGDYIDVELWLDGKMVESFGDDYHNKGDETLGGFLQGLKYAFGTLPEPQREDIERGDS